MKYRSFYSEECIKSDLERAVFEKCKISTFIFLSFESQ